MCHFVSLLLLFFLPGFFFQGFSRQNTVRKTQDFFRQNTRFFRQNTRGNFNLALGNLTDCKLTIVIIQVIQVIQVSTSIK